MIPGLVRSGLAAPFALIAGFAALFVLGTVAAGLDGRLSATGVLIACAALVGGVSFVSEPATAVPLAVIGWLTAVGFSQPPYADLRPTGPHAVHSAVAVGTSALVGAGAGLLFRWSALRFTLGVVGIEAGTGDSGQEAASDGALRQAA